jgi:hypothetical protein
VRHDQCLLSTVLSHLEGKRRAFVDSYEIAPLTSIRNVKQDGMMTILHQISKSGWNHALAGILVVELKDNP